MKASARSSPPNRGLDLHDAVIEGGRHRLRPILMTAFATMLALAPLAVIGGGGGVGGAFISGPLAIVVIGGLFTSTVLTLVLVPVLYSLAARFASRRSTKDLDELLDAAEDRRFKPLGYRAGGRLAAVAAGEYAFSLTGAGTRPSWRPKRPGSTHSQRADGRARRRDREDADWRAGG